VLNDVKAKAVVTVRSSMYDDILVATDGSNIAANAASMGISLARRFGGEIHALSDRRRETR